MAGDIEKYFWADLSSAPDNPGVYAWYYSPEITKVDLERTVATAEAADNNVESEEVIKRLLEDCIFSFFREDPYSASITGPLKAAYAGALEHQAEISNGLVARLAAQPERLHRVRDVLALSAPMFASPLYIGMATSLRSRLAAHRNLIERFRSMSSRDGTLLRNSDAGFAWQVAKRKIPPARLFVYTCAFHSDDADIAVDVENILNRICHPILGRN